MIRAAGLLLTAMVAATDPHYFRYERPVIGTTFQSPQTCVALDATVFEHSLPSLSDLRLYRDGKEVPYALQVAAPVAAPAGNITVLNLGERDGHVVFGAAMPSGRYRDLELDLSARDFVARVEVFGSQSQSAGTETKIGSFTIFDFTREKLGRSTVLHLPESDFHYLHFQIDGPLKPEDVKGIILAGAGEAKLDYVTVAESTQGSQKSRDMVFEFSLSANVPVDRLEFAVQSEPANFSRDVTVTVIPQRMSSHSEDREAQPSSSYGNILRLHSVRNGVRIDDERLSVDVPQSAGNVPTKWSVTIDNGDDPPLALRSVRLQMLERTLCFESATGTNYMLYYGDAALSAPRYDYATLFTREEKAARARLGRERENPNYRPRPDERPFIEKHPALLWTAIVVVVVLLGSIALRSAKQVQQR